MNGGRLTRRELLGLVGVLILGTGLPVSARRTVMSDGADDDAATSVRLYVDRLRSLSADRVGLRRLGMRAVQHGPREPDALLQALKDVFGPAHGLGDVEDDELRSRLASAARLDFQNQRVVRVDGWLLSRAEVSVAVAFHRYA